MIDVDRPGELVDRGVAVAATPEKAGVDERGSVRRELRDEGVVGAVAEAVRPARGVEGPRAGREVGGEGGPRQIRLSRGVEGDSEGPVGGTAAQVGRVAETGAGRIELGCEGVPGSRVAEAVAAALLVEGARGVGKSVDFV